MYSKSVIENQVYIALNPSGFMNTEMFWGIQYFEDLEFCYIYSGVYATFFCIACV